MKFCKLQAIYYLVLLNPCASYANCLEVAVAQLDTASNQLQDFYSEAKKGYPRLYKFLGSRTIQRWKTSSDSGWSEYFAQIAGCRSSDCILEVYGDTFYLKARIIKADKNLEIRIFSFVSKVFSKNADGWVPLDMGEVPRSGMHSSLPNLVGVTFEGLKKLAERDQKIQNISLVGKSVVNSALAKNLESFGFEAITYKKLFNPATEVEYIHEGSSKSNGKWGDRPVTDWTATIQIRPSSP